MVAGALCAGRWADHARGGFRGDVAPVSVAGKSGFAHVAAEARVAGCRRTSSPTIRNRVGTPADGTIRLRSFTGGCDQDRMGAHYEIRPVREADLAMLGAWRSRPHVSRWWGAAEVEPETDKLPERRVAMWIAEGGSRPFAFIQDYRISDWSPHHFDVLPAGSRGIDMYIGEPEMLGAGHGSRLLRQHAEHLLKRGAPALGIDPHPDNLPAIRAFGRAGFTVIGGPLDTRWGRAVLMARSA